MRQEAAERDGGYNKSDKKQFEKRTSTVLISSIL